MSMKQVPVTQGGGRTVERPGAAVAEHWHHQERPAAPEVKLSDKTLAEVKAIKEKWAPYLGSALIPVLHTVQRERGFLDAAAQEWVGAELGIEPVRVREVVTFYEMFHEEPRGRHQIGVCRTLSCYLGGAEQLTKHICAKLGIKPHESTADGKFFLHELECIGACDKAPAMMIGDTHYENLTPKKADEILDRLAKES